MAGGRPYIFLLENVPVEPAWRRHGCKGVLTEKCAVVAMSTPRSPLYTIFCKAWQGFGERAGEGRVKPPGKEEKKVGWGKEEGGKTKGWN